MVEAFLADMNVTVTEWQRDVLDRLFRVQRTSSAHDSDLHSIVKREAISIPVVFVMNVTT